MKTHRARRLPLLAAISPLVLAFACDAGGANDSLDPTPAAFAGAPLTPAPKPAIPTGPVALVVRPAHEPTGPIVAVLQTPSGLPTASVTISAGETATLEVPIGGMITVGYQVGDQWFLDTVAGVEPGDSLELGAPRTPPSPPVGTAGTDLLDGQLVVSNLPVGALSATTALFATSDGVRVRCDAAPKASISPANASAQNTPFRCPSGLTHAQLEYSVAFDADALEVSTVIDSRELRPDLALDASTGLLPHLSAPRITNGGSDLDRASVDFTADGPIDGADGLYVQLHGGRIGAWNLFLPAAQHVDLPALGAGDAQLAVAQAIGDGAVGMTIEVVDSDRVGGFAALRRVPMTSFGYALPRPAGDYRLRETAVTTH